MKWCWEPRGRGPRNPSERDASELDIRASWKFLGKRLPDLIFHTVVNLGVGGEEKGKKIYQIVKALYRVPPERLVSQSILCGERQRWSGGGLLGLMRNG